MRLCEALGKRGLVALAFLVSCGGGAPPAPEVPVEKARTAEELRALLASIAERQDSEAAIARARIYDRLRGLGQPGPAELLARGDAADLDVLSQGAPPSHRSEAATRLSRHFRERAQVPELCRMTLPGPWGGALRRYVLLTISTCFGECASPVEHAASLGRLANVADELADMEAVKPEARESWKRKALDYTLRAAEVLAAPEPRETGAAARKFCDQDLARHLEEANRAVEAGTREKVARGDESRVLEWYLEALAHFLVVGECLLEPTPAQNSALSPVEIVARSIVDLLARQP